MHEIKNTAQSLRFSLLAGHATVTLRGRRTGTRFTYRIQRKTGATAPHFVKVLTGPDNGSDYTFLGTIFADGEYRHSGKSSIGSESPSAVMFRQVWARISRLVSDGKGDSDIPEIEVFHMGSCLRCGRALTTPESVERGLGPECAEKA